MTASVELARLRALGAASLRDASAMEHAAAAIGRTPQRAGPDVVLARHPEAPSAGDLEVIPATLADSALVALGLCVGLAWDDRERSPYPGRSFTFDDLATAARSMNINVAASRHIIGAVRHVLAQARLIDIDGDRIRLGPLVAAWSDADLEGFRRNLDALPEPTRADE